MLFHGGETIKETVSKVTDEVIARVENSEKYLPEDNAITSRLLKIFTEEIPGTAHYLFCDTGYFSKLPEGASTYAVPYEFTKQGVRKYEATACATTGCMTVSVVCQAAAGIKKIVSIFVGSRTNVADICYLRDFGWVYAG